LKGPQIFLTVAFLLAALVIAEKIFVTPPLYSEELLSWGQQTSLGVQGAGEPPQIVGVPAQSTLTHGRQVDDGNALSAEMQIAQAQQIAKQEFQRFLQDTTQRLPTLAKAQQLTVKEAHGHPQILTDSAVDLGELAQKIESNPSFKPDALGFYQNCALSSQVLKSVRALCFNRAQTLSVDIHQDIWDFDPTLIPADVIELAKQL